MQAILTRYTHLPGNIDLVFKSLCALVSEQPTKVDWSSFTSQEWALFSMLAVEENVAPMAYFVLQSNPEAYHLAEFDKHTYQVLCEHEAVTAVRNAWLFNHLGHILTQFQVNGIPTVLVKGADLANSLYPQPGLRWLTDLDLLVQKTHFEQALELAKSLGYHEFLPEASPGLDRFISNHAHMIKDVKVPILLELHWSLIGPEAFRYAVPMDWFWHNLEPSQLWADKILPGDQKSVCVLNPTANLLFLSAHLMLQHGGDLASLQWLLDIHRLVKYRGLEIDWQALTQQARSFGWSGALMGALKAAQDCFATPLPEGLLPVLQSQVDPNDGLVVMKAKEAPTRILGEWKKLNSLNWQGRLRLVFALMIPGPAYMRWRYEPQPEWIWPLYYLYRWFDIARDGWRTIILMFNPLSK
jgi:hypothetical protein